MKETCRALTTLGVINQVKFVVYSKHVTSTALFNTKDEKSNLDINTITITSI